MSARQPQSGAAALAAAVQALYAEGQTDYWLEPVVLQDEQGLPVGCIQDGDAVIFCCRRGEREIQLTEAFVDSGLDRFPRRDFHNLTFVILTLYHEKFKSLPVAFAPTKLRGTLAEVVSRAGRRQMHVAESEKFAHVTFFFNGGSNQPFAGEEDVRVPSPSGVAFDQAPAMSMPQVASEALRGVEEGFDLVVANFANGDVVGHSSNDQAKLRCAEMVDAQLGSLMSRVLDAGYVVMLTADHGNLEEMTGPDGKPHVAHTANPVPFLIADAHVRPPVALRQGSLADVAPTVLQAMGLAPAQEMEGASLAGEHEWGGHRRVLLLILDGWGIGRSDHTNPIYLASTPAWDDLRRRFPWAPIQAAGQSVGLAPGKAGNSEAGHINMGAGRVVLQDDVRLDQAMKDGTFGNNETLCRAIDEARARGASLHLIGLLTERSSHGSIDYPLELLRMAKARDLHRVYLHLIFDGRSTEPGSAPALLNSLQRQIARIGVGQVVTGVGRGIALDRDGNYARTRQAYDALVFGAGRGFPRLAAA